MAFGLHFENMVLCPLQLKNLQSARNPKFSDFPRLAGCMGGVELLQSTLGGTDAGLGAWQDQRPPYWRLAIFAEACSMASPSGRMERLRHGNRAAPC